MKTMTFAAEMTELPCLADVYRCNPRRGFDLLYQGLSGRVTTFLKRAFNLSEEEVADVVHDAFLPWVENPEKMLSIVNPRAYLFSTARFMAIRKKREATRTTSDALQCIPIFNVREGFGWKGFEG